MKTFLELISGGTMIEIATAIKANTDRVQALFSEATKRADKANTQTELDEILKLDDETEKLQAKYAELKKIEDAKTRNADRIKAFNTSNPPVPFPGGSSNDPNDGNGDAKKSHTQIYTSIASLKHINVGTRQENEEKAFRFFQFFAAVCLRPDSALRAKAAQYCTDNGIPIKALNEGRNEEGGALVPPEFDPMLIRLIERFGLFRGFTRMVPMGSDTRMQPRRTGGVTAFWVGEGKQITASNPTFDNVSLVAKKLAALTVMSSEISEDSAINIADELAFEIGYAMALSEDQAGFNGDGTSAFGGIQGIVPKLLSLDATPANIAGIFIAPSGHASWDTLTLSDFNNTVALLPQYADTPNAGWYCHRGFYYGCMQRLEMAAGGVTAFEIAQGDRRPRPLFLGYPVNFSQVFPRISAVSQIPVILGDLAMGTMMGDRRTRTIFTDPYSLSNFDQIQVRGTERIDINFHDTGNASATPALRQPGSIVALRTAAS
jgi:HK97 family phage major capsid protein